jgi:hypothetical protein
MEKPEHGADRIDVERLDSNDLAGEDVTLGYLVKVDRLGPGTSGWVTSRNFPLTEPFGSKVRLNYGYPDEAPAPAPAIPAQQSKYIRDYIQTFEGAVVQPNPTTTGLADLPIITPSAPETWSVTVFHAPGADDAYPVIETASAPAS